MSASSESAPPARSESRPQRMLEFRSGGWVLALAGLIGVMTLVWHGVTILKNLDHRAVGDGRTLESYGYDLRTLLVPRERLYPIGIDLRKDGLPAMDHPPRIAAVDLGREDKLGGVRHLLPGERVIGVAIGGEAVAYPLWVLDWHEIVNDTVGGRPIVVTYNGICDSAAVFDRRAGGVERTFGFSGLLYNGNLVIYDRAPRAGAGDFQQAAEVSARPGALAGAAQAADRPRAASGAQVAGAGHPAGAAQTDSAGESLWSQLQMRAIAGPAAAAGLTLELIPFELTTWEAWRDAHADTRVILPDIDRKRIYKRDAYSKYRATDELKFPVDPLPTDGRAYKTPIVAVANGDGWEVIPAGQFDPAAIPPDTPRVYAYWFAWYAVNEN